MGMVKDFGNNLKKYRKQTGLSQKTFDDQCLHSLKGVAVERFVAVLK